MTKRPVVVLPSVLVVAVLTLTTSFSCHAFVLPNYQKSLVVRGHCSFQSPSSSPFSPFANDNSNRHFQPSQQHCSPAKEKSPSSSSSSSSSLVVLHGTSNLMDYSNAARGLFDNVISPAALLAGALIPLGFLAPPLPSDKNRLYKRLARIYSLLAVFSLANQLTAIVYATVASNKLVEITSPPTTSVFALLKRDYELSWIGTNVHFLLGLLGFMSMVGLRAYTMYPCTLNKAASGLCLSALLGMCSIVNRGVSAGGSVDGSTTITDYQGGRLKFGHSILTLAYRYVLLLLRQVSRKGGLLAMVAMTMGVLSTIMAIRAVVVCPDEEDDEE